MSDTLRNGIEHHLDVCDECGSPTMASSRELASGVKCGDCEEVPPWP